MKIGLMTESLGDMPFEAMLAACAEMGIESVEFGTGNWFAAPFVELDRLIESAPARREFLAKIADHGLDICALDCHGNPLAPGEPGKRHDAVVRKTFELASLLGVDRVVATSGLPAAPGDSAPNWITHTWPPEGLEILEYQWNEVAIPYWRDMVAFAANLGIRKIAFEILFNTLVYNTAAVLKLREAAGEAIGANMDPSHMMAMGGEPLTAIPRLAGAIHHVHAKDSRIDPANAGPNTLIDVTPDDRVTERAWSYVTLGYGHGEAWWREFAFRLRAAGYDDVLSIEHEDHLTNRMEGVRKSVELLQRVMLRDPPSYGTPDPS